ncbi:MAG: CBS domain-containing protein [Marinovum sp.]|mgnify:FL=1|jgi:CBS domain-containing protein|nr:CBS domain-containing protein [Marinovum sp.]MBT6507311.1 CBS domain-containing protein [Marinovum sp.]MBT7906590.1 CBS domain-containing protein [Marinovum sp.]MDG2231857.1 CBS domain-containing protein [Paracoccaceae bacterium]
MLVQQILNSKANDDVITVQPETTLVEAAAILASNKIGTVVISEDGKKASGILSERDIVRAIAHRGVQALGAPVNDFMTRKIVTCRREATADQVLTIMTDKRFRHIPVVENGEMIGLITQGDVVKAKLSELSMEKDALEGMIMGY